MVKPRDINLAIKIYEKAGAHAQAGQAYIESG